jgi:hypothetical protein
MAGATTLVDALGIPIAVGAQVRLTGLVTSVTPLDTHYGEVSVTPTYPVVPKANMGIINDIANGVATPTLNANPINVAPGMLVVGIGTGGGGMSQTPWVTDIDGGNKNLYNVASIATGPVTVTGDVNITGAFRVNGVILPGQTPWLQNVNAANFTLTNVASISSGPVAVTGNVNITGNYLVNGVPIPGQTPWQQNVNGNGFALSGVSTVAATGNITASNVNVTGNFQVNGVNIPTALTPWISNVSAAGFRLLNLAPALGVGVTSPAYAVDVLGDINCSGTLRVKGISIAAGGGVQTPWMQDITANSHQLIGVGTITSSVTGATLAFGTQSSTASITGAGDATFNSVTVTNGAVRSPGTATFSTTGGSLLETTASDFWIVTPPTTGNIYLQTGGKQRLEISQAGNVTISAPDSGAALNVIGELDAVSISASGLVSANNGFQMADVQNPSFNYSFAVSGGTFSLKSSWVPSGILSISSAGNVTINAPGSGVALNIAGGFLINAISFSTAGYVHLDTAPSGNTASTTFDFFPATNTTGVAELVVWKPNGAQNTHVVIVDAQTGNITSSGSFGSTAAGAALAFNTTANAATITGAGDAVFNSVTFGPSGNRAQLSVYTGGSFPIAQAVFAGAIGIVGSGATGQIIMATGTGGGSRMIISPAGNVTINGPDSGIALTAPSLGSGAGNSLTINTNLNPRILIDSSGVISINPIDGAQAYSEIIMAGAVGAFLVAQSGPLFLRAVAGVINLETGGSNTNRLTVNTAGNVTINAPDSGNALTVAGPTSLTGAGGIFSITNLPSVAPAAGSKQLWYDPADSNRVKFAA